MSKAQWKNFSWQKFARVYQQKTGERIAPNSAKYIHDRALLKIKNHLVGDREIASILFRR